MLQCACSAAPGITGHDSFAASHTVMTHAKASPRNGRIVLLRWPLMSMPISPITAMASGRTWLASVPALNASKRSPPQARTMPSAIWLRALLWVHTKRTRVGWSPVVSMGESYDGGVNAGSSRVNVHHCG